MCLDTDPDAQCCALRVILDEKEEACDITLTVWDHQLPDTFISAIITAGLDLQIGSLTLELSRPYASVMMCLQ